MNLLNRLIEDLGKIDESKIKANQPIIAVQPGDKVIGILPDELKPLYILATNLSIYRHKLAAQLAKKFMQEKMPAGQYQKPEDIPEKEFENFDQVIGVVNNYAKAARSLFFTSVRCTFPELIGKDFMEIRKGWQVVILPLKRKRHTKIL